jgi:hypothetical protein
MIDLNKLAKDFADDELDPETYKVIKEGDWINEHKYQYQETIISYQNKLYCICQSRSGSYWSDYEYNDPEAYEVEPHEVTVIEYRVVQ